MWTLQDHTMGPFFTVYLATLSALATWHGCTHIYHKWLDRRVAPPYDVPATSYDDQDRGSQYTTL